MERGASPTVSTFRLAWRLCCLAFLAVLWLPDPGGAGLIGILALLALGVARWRFPLPVWTVVADQALCVALLGAWPGAAFALVLPVFDAAADARPWCALPGVAAAAFMASPTLGLAAVLAAAAACGACAAFWARQTARLRREADAERGARLEAERLRDELARDGARAAQVATLAERARIARDLHDHAGHEVIAAQLALDAFAQLWREADPQAGEMLEHARGRLREGMGVLRATVRGMAPSVGVGVAALDDICRAFDGPPSRLIVTGNAEAVPPFAWAVLEPCLKEALTNAARHGSPMGIEAALDVGPHIVRLCVASGPSDDGRPAGAPATSARAEAATVPAAVGLGLRSLHQRARAVGGSVTTDTSAGFRLICVLPLPDTAPGAGNGGQQSAGSRASGGSRGLEAAP
jgi:two-component system, NarL family, sensor histidine kinase DesK